MCKWNTSSTLTLNIWIVESSMPIAIMLLSWGWKAKDVAAGGGAINVVIVWKSSKIFLELKIHVHERKGTNYNRSLHNTLKVIILNKEIFPPEADITYESFLDKAKQGTASSGFVSGISLVIKIPLCGYHNWGETLAVAYKHSRKEMISAVL